MTEFFDTVPVPSKLGLVDWMKILPCPYIDRSDTSIVDAQGSEINYQDTRP